MSDRVRTIGLILQLPVKLFAVDAQRIGFGNFHSRAPSLECEEATMGLYNRDTATPGLCRLRTRADAAPPRHQRDCPVDRRKLCDPPRAAPTGKELGLL